MIRRALWRVASTEILARIALGFVALALASIGVRVSSPWIGAGAAVFVMVLIYRLRYHRF